MITPGGMFHRPKGVLFGPKDALLVRSPKDALLARSPKDALLARSPKNELLARRAIKRISVRRADAPAVCRGWRSAGVADD
jgi:hypothetical protein